MATGSESKGRGGNKGSKIARSTAASRRGRNEIPFPTPKEGKVVRSNITRGRQPKRKHRNSVKNGH